MTNKQEEFDEKEKFEDEEVHGENLDNGKEDDKENETDSSEQKEEVEILKKDKKELEEKLKEANDKVLRISADTDNYRKRLAKESEDKVKFANQSLILDLLNVVDHLEMALSHSDENFSVDALRQGVELALKQFKDILSKYGVEEIKVEEGDKFDPNVHEAMMLDEREDLENNHISMVMQKGYKLHDRVIRSSKVKVNKKKENKKDKQEENNE